MKLTKHDVRKVLEKIASDPRFHGKWMPPQAWTILTSRLSVDLIKQKAVAVALREYCDSCTGYKLPSLCIKTHDFTVQSEGTNSSNKCSFFLIHPESKQPDESTLNVYGGRALWQKRYDDALSYCRSIPPTPLVELQALANARVEQVNARYREQEQKAMAARRQQEEETAIAAQDPRERALEMLRVAWESYYSEEFPKELFQNLNGKKSTIDVI